MGEVLITSFDGRWCRDHFSCGKPELDDWLREQAGQAERRNNTRTFLAVEEATSTVVGYYSTTTYRLELDEVAVAFGSGRHRYPVPAVLLARLAVASSHQGRGLGTVLLVDALRRVAAASESVGFEVLVVHAIDQQAATFYRYFGFTPFVDHEEHLMITTKDLLATLDAQL
jgi:GNAT superfamily N-acetyltransferase